VGNHADRNLNQTGSFTLEDKLGHHDQAKQDKHADHDEHAVIPRRMSETSQSLEPDLEGTAFQRAQGQSHHRRPKKQQQQYDHASAQNQPSAGIAARQSLQGHRKRQHGAHQKDVRTAPPRRPQLDQVAVGQRNRVQQPLDGPDPDCARVRALQRVRPEALTSNPVATARAQELANLATQEFSA